MIQELVEYSKWLKRDFPDLFEGQIEEGLHLCIKIHADQISNLKSCKIGKNTPSCNIENNFVFEYANEVFKSNVINTNKCIHNDKYILSNNPFCYKLNLVTETEFKKDISRIGQVRRQKIENHLKVIKKDFFPNYDEEIKKIADAAMQIFLNISTEVIRSIKIDKAGHVYLDSEDAIVTEILQSIKNAFLAEKDFENIESFLKKIKKKKVIVYFEVDKNYYTKTSEIYFKKKGGLKQSIPTLKIENEQFVLNSFVNNDNENKKFLKHLTAYNKYNYYHQKQLDDLLEEFKPVMKNLPIPLPIFVIKPELNKKAIKIFKKDSKKGYKEIISELYNDNKDDLQNYYLFNGTRQSINDFDYVVSFQYEVDNLKDQSYFTLFGVKPEYKFNNIFAIERIINSKFLFKINKRNNSQIDMLSMNYFKEKIDVGKGYEIPLFILNNIYRYRKYLYDAFYKSRLYLINATIFQNICMPVIRYEICHDEANGKYSSKNEEVIKEKLLIYIHINRIFDPSNKNFGGIDMPSQLPRYYNNLLKLLRGDIDFYQSDQDFAFGTGQLIRYLLEQSESSNKNHSMLNPFLQKLGDFDIFIKHLNQVLKTYGYKIKMNYDLFDKVMSNTTGYNVEENRCLKDLEPIFICGYFAKSAFSQIISERTAKKEKSIN